MTTRENVWLLKDDQQEQHPGAIRADMVTGFALVPHSDHHRFVVTTVHDRQVSLGMCRPEHRDEMAGGFLSVLRQAETSDAHFLVVEAVPLGEQTGGFGYWWQVYENSWPDATQRPAMTL